MKIGYESYPNDQYRGVVKYWFNSMLKDYKIIYAP
jgi:hypothetical protein